MAIALASAAHPPSPPEISAAAIYGAHAISRPATAFTGDFYVTTTACDQFWFAVGDFAGHGLDAAIFTAMIQEELEVLLDSCEISPGEVVAALDGMLRHEIPGNRFATLVVGKARPDGLVEIVNAGHCPPIVSRRDGRSEPIDSHGPIVGLVPAPCWRSETVALDPGDRIAVYTDGVVEAEDEKGEPFGVDRLASLIRFTPEAALGAVLDAARTFAGDEQKDDATLLVVSRNG